MRNGLLFLLAAAFSVCAKDPVLPVVPTPRVKPVVSQLAPREQAAEFYGFLSVAGRTSTFVGPLVFSTISYRMHNRYVKLGFEELQAEKLGLLWAIGAIIAFLIVGALLLILVRQPGKNGQPRKPR